MVFSLFITGDNSICIYPESQRLKDVLKTKKLLKRLRYMQI